MKPTNLAPSTIDSECWEEALAEYRRRTGDDTPTAEIPIAKLSEILGDAQKRKEQRARDTAAV